MKWIGEECLLAEMIAGSTIKDRQTLAELLAVLSDNIPETDVQADHQAFFGYVNAILEMEGWKEGEADLLYEALRTQRFGEASRISLYLAIAEHLSCPLRVTRKGAFFWNSDDTQKIIIPPDSSGNDWTFLKGPVKKAVRQNELYTRGAWIAYTYAKVSEVCRVRGKPDLAMVAAKEALERDPHSQAALLCRGLLHYETGSVSEALQDYNKGIVVGGEKGELTPELYAARAEIKINSGQESSGLRDLRRALEINPDCASAYELRGIFMGEKGQEHIAYHDAKRRDGYLAKDDFWVEVTWTREARKRANSQ